MSVHSKHVFPQRYGLQGREQMCKTHAHTHKQPREARAYPCDHTTCRNHMGTQLQIIVQQQRQHVLQCCRGGHNKLHDSPRPPMQRAGMLQSMHIHTNRQVVLADTRNMNRQAQIAPGAALQNDELRSSTRRAANENLQTHD